MKEDNTLKNEAGLNDLISISLLPGGTEKIRDQLKIFSASDFVKYVSNTKNISISEAQTLIKDSPVLMKLLFMVA